MKLSRYLTLGSVGDVVTQQRPPQLSDFGGGGIRSPIVIDGRTGEAWIYVNGVITPLNSVNVKAFGAVGNGIKDDTAAFQAAVKANPRGALYVPPGAYKYTSEIPILTTMHIYAHPFTATMYAGAPNINCFVVGDGTSATGGNVAGFHLDGLQFSVLPGVPASSSGACIVVNNVHYCYISNTNIDGRSGGVSLLWNGIYISKSLEWVIDRPTINGFLNNGIRCDGIVSATCGDGRIDFPEVIACVSDCIYFGDYTGAITVTAPIMYSYNAWGIKVDCTQAAGVGANYLISQPDLEASHPTLALGGIYVKQGTAQVEGGWLGGTAGLKVDALGSSVTMSGVINQADVPVVIDGPACSLIGCDISGTNTGISPTGVLLNAGATDTQILGGRIRQFPTDGVKFVGAPVRCEVLGVNFRSNGTDITSPPPDLNATAAPKGSTTPVPTSGTGVFTTVAATVNWTKANDRAAFDMVVSITTNGTAATDIRVPMPFAAAVITAIDGIVQQNGKAISGYVSGGTAFLFLYDGTYPGANGLDIRVSGSYKV